MWLCQVIVSLHSGSGVRHVEGVRESESGRAHAGPSLIGGKYMDGG
jgi:hypothetical protein